MIEIGNHSIIKTTKQLYNDIDGWKSTIFYIQDLLCILPICKMQLLSIVLNGKNPVFSFKILGNENIFECPEFYLSEIKKFLDNGTFIIEEE